MWILPGSPDIFWFLLSHGLFSVFILQRKEKSGPSYVVGTGLEKRRQSRQDVPVDSQLVTIPPWVQRSYL